MWVQDTGSIAVARAIIWSFFFAEEINPAKAETFSKQKIFG
jgi:hypothetical protein